MFCYTQLAVGIKMSPDVAQHMITKILTGLDCVAYNDNFGIWTDTIFEEHMNATLWCAAGQWKKHNFLDTG